MSKHLVHVIILKKTFLINRFYRFSLHSLDISMLYTYCNLSYNISVRTLESFKVIMFLLYNLLTLQLCNLLTLELYNLLTLTK